MEVGLSSESDWALLPKSFLYMILDNLVSLSDHVRLGAVCKPWYSVVMESRVQLFQNKCLRQVPFLMVPSEDNSEERRSLYSITHDKLCKFQLPVPYKKRLSGSSYGWLFMVEETMGVTLINPFSGATIELPPITDPSEYEQLIAEEIAMWDADLDHELFEIVPAQIHFEFEVTKAILSADPASFPNNYTVSAIYGEHGRLAFLLPRDEAWTYMDEKYDSILDVIYYKGQIFAVDYFSGIISVDLNRRAGESMVPQVKLIAPQIQQGDQTVYLVESSSGDLLLVKRFLKFDENNQHTTVNFEIFKMLLDQAEDSLAKHVELKSLGGDSLFLGDNHSICVSASKWPGCQPNSIYYTDDSADVLNYLPDGRCDIGIFNIETGCFGTHYILDASHKHMPPAIWIVPTIKGNLVEK